MAEPSFKESLLVEGGQLLVRLRQLLQEGNVRRIVIRQGERTLIEIPLTVGVLGALGMPVLATIGVLAALLSSCTIEVEREAPSAVGGGPDSTAG